MGWSNLSIPILPHCNRWSLGMDNFIPHFIMDVINDLSMPRFKLIHVSKREPLNFQDQIFNVLYLNKNWSHCNETEDGHVEGMIGLPQLWLLILTLAMTLTSKFPGQVNLPVSKNVQLPRNQNRTCWLNATGPQMWPSILTLTLTLTFTWSWL